MKNKFIISLFSFAFLIATISPVFALYNDSSISDANIQIQNVYLDNKFLVKFLNADGTTFYSKEVVSGNTVGEVPVSIPTLEEYTFDGWSNDDEFTKLSNETIESMVVTSDLTFFARFASYGYAVSGEVYHLENKWDISNNITFTSGDVVTLGTYIYGKDELENACSDINIIYDGGYAIVCGEHESSWNATSAAILSNWHIEKYLEFSPLESWYSDNKNIWTYYFGNVDAIWKKLTKLDNSDTYYCYSPYNATNVIFLSKTDDTASFDNVFHQSADIALSNISSYIQPNGVIEKWGYNNGNYTYELTIDISAISWFNNDGAYLAFVGWNDGNHKHIYVPTNGATILPANHGYTTFIVLRMNKDNVYENGSDVGSWPNGVYNQSNDISLNNSCSKIRLTGEMDGKFTYEWNVR